MTLLTSRRLHLLACAAFAAAVAGCGGGGSDSSASGPTNTAPPTPTPALDDIVTSVAAPTYAAGSGELAQFQRLNEQRGKCGFGLVAQNVAIDRAAAAHLAYERSNNVFDHNESSALPGYTGANVGARLTAAGYAWNNASENLGLGSRDAEAVQAMLDLPYHSVGALGGFRDVGIAYDGTTSHFVINYANPTGQQLQTAAGVRTYPCEGSQNVMPVLAGEIPSPFPNESGATWGPTISVVGTRVVVAKASVTGPAGSVAIRTIYGDGATVDPNNWCKGAKACVIPAPLAKATSYTVHVEGTNSGVPFTKDFSFKTAS